ncbi:MAG: hypothetical protein IKX62_01145 [Bacteroidales bacterium]|nr:hypothetical protein [Bacteroidales bacterium]
MKSTTRFVPFSALLAALLSSAVLSCTKIPLNEAAGSYFYHDNSRVVFEDEGYMAKYIQTDNFVIACYTGPKVIGEERDCINIFIPQNSFTLTNNRLTFRNPVNARIRFYSELSEPGGHALIHIHLQQETKARISGTITNDKTYDFFQTGNVYHSPLSISFSLDDGSRISLRMNTMTVVDDPTLYSGWTSSVF